jgi:hypothetical protein
MFLGYPFQQVQILNRLQHSSLNTGKLASAFCYRILTIDG